VASSYQAKIDLIVTGLEKIKAAETRIKNLVSESKKLKRGSTAQRGTVALATVTRTERQASQKSVRIAEQKLTLQSKLNAATDLYNRKLREFTRAGGESNSKLQGRVDQIKQAFQAGTRGGQKNIRLARALATELGRVVEKQRESNRLQVIRNKGFEEGRRGFERIEALKAGGVSDSRGLGRAESLVKGIGVAAQTGDQAAYNEAVRKAKAVLNRLERDYKNASTAQKASTKAKRDVERAEKRLAAETKKAETASAARRRARKQKFTDVATGFGFPLLFGGGPLQAVAGGLGGAAGGLGGSIAASALTAQVEAFATEAATVGQALNSTGGALELMREKSLFSTDAARERAAVLEELGQVEELAAHLGQEMAKAIGNEGVKALQDLGETSKETTRLWNLLTVQLFKLISGPLNAFLKIVNQALGGITVQQQVEARKVDLGADGAAALDARIAELVAGDDSGITEKRKRRGFKGAGGLSKTDARTQALGEAQFQVAAKPLPITKQDQRDFSVSGGDKAAKDKARLDQKLAALEQERQKILEISAFKDKIAAAEAASDSQLVIRLQGEQRIAQIESKRLTDLTKVKDQRLIDAININAATEKLAAQRQTERDITEEQRKRQELFDTTIEGLEHQLKMTEATSQAERDRLKIAREMKKLEDKGLKGDQLTQAQGLMERLAVAQQPLNAFITKATDDLNNLQQVAVDVSQGIGNAIGGSLVNGLQGLVTGATSVKQVFADMLRSVADVLAKTASQMIAQYIAIGIAKAFAGMGGGFNSPAASPGGSAGVAGIGGGGLGDVFGNTSLFEYAEGGYVNKPTNALIGEGGEPEYVIPESKMRESMSRYSRGSRGNSVIPTSGGGAEDSGGGTAVAAPIDVRYTVERINSVDYVTADQFQSGMKQAASQGAKQGEQQTLKRLQMSGGTRKRLGM
jgi:hypothetical protein